MGARRQGRILAFQALYAYEYTHPPLEELLQFAWLDTSPEDDASETRKSSPTASRSREALDFARLLVAGTIENICAIDDRIRGQLDHWDFSRIARVDLSILRLSVYSLLYVDSIPASVTIDEAVSLAREFGSSESYRFVNGVLDGIRRTQAAAEA